MPPKRGGKPSGVGVAWLGAPIHKMEGDDYYRGFTRWGTEYLVGDVVTLDARGKGNLRKCRGSVYVAEIESLWEDCYAAKWAEFRWYYYPEEAGTPAVHEREVLESPHMDENELDAIVDKVEVMPTDAFLARLASKPTWVPGDTRTYCAGRFYDPTTKMFRPLHGTVQASKYSRRYLRVADVHGGAALRGTVTAPLIASPSAPKRRKAAADAAPAPVATDAFATAAAQLQLSASPPELPCRDAEKETIGEFLETGIRSAGVNHALYISGMPGTGKTATVREVVRSLYASHTRGELPPFQYVEINSMQLPNPYHLYSTLWRELDGEVAPPLKSLSSLQDRFSKASSKRQCTVLLVDELDYLVTKKQSVLYNLFEWPTMKHSRLIVVGIANTMDLPERLMPKVLSRLGLARVVFPPYTREQIRTILKARLEKLDVFKSDAVELAAGKVAALSGDIRRALQMCRRSTEVAQERCKGGAGPRRVTVDDISAAAAELSASQHVVALRGCGPWERAMVCCVMMHARANACEDVGTGDAIARVKALCARTPALGGEPSMGDCLFVINTLTSLQLLKSESVKSERFPRLSLGMLPEDVEYALGEDPAFASCFA